MCVAHFILFIKGYFYLCTTLAVNEHHNNKKIKKKIKKINKTILREENPPIEQGLKSASTGYMSAVITSGLCVALLLFMTWQAGIESKA